MTERDLLSTDWGVNTDWKGNEVEPTVTIQADDPSGWEDAYFDRDVGGENMSNPVVTREAARDMWQAALRSAERTLSPGECVSHLKSVLCNLNELTECSSGDPLGFFLSQAYDKRLKEREEINRVLPSEIRELVGQSVPHVLPESFFRALSATGLAKCSLKHFLRLLLAEGASERELDRAGIDACKDDLNRLRVGEREVVVFVW